MKKYNPLAYEKAFDTLGEKFWREMPSEIKYDFLESFILWRTPNLDRRLAKPLAVSYMNYTYGEFDTNTQFDMRRFMKQYAHTAKFMGWMRTR